MMRNASPVVGSSVTDMESRPSPAEPTEKTATGSAEPLATPASGTMPSTTGSCRRMSVVANCTTPDAPGRNDSARSRVATTSTDRPPARVGATSVPDSAPLRSRPGIGPAPCTRDLTRTPAVAATPIRHPPRRRASSQRATTLAGRSASVTGERVNPHGDSRTALPDAGGWTGNLRFRYQTTTKDEGAANSSPTTRAELLDHLNGRSHFPAGGGGSRCQYQPSSVPPPGLHARCYGLTLELGQSPGLPWSRPSRTGPRNTSSTPKARVPALPCASAREVAATDDACRDNGTRASLRTCHPPIGSGPAPAAHALARRRGVLYVGVAQEKARVLRTERREDPVRGPYPWLVSSSASIPRRAPSN